MEIKVDLVKIVSDAQRRAWNEAMQRPATAPSATDNIVNDIKAAMAELGVIVLDPDPPAAEEESGAVRTSAEIISEKLGLNEQAQEVREAVVERALAEPPVTAPATPEA
jgi:hypothetical protein